MYKLKVDWRSLILTDHFTKRYMQRFGDCIYADMKNSIINSINNGRILSEEETIFAKNLRGVGYLEDKDIHVIDDIGRVFILQPRPDKKKPNSTFYRATTCYEAKYLQDRRN